MLASICCVAFYGLRIIQSWPTENTAYSRPYHWEQHHPECLERFRFWPDGSRIEDSDKIYTYSDVVRRYGLRNGGKETPQQAAKDDWLRDVQDKILKCERPQWEPIVKAEAIQDQWLRLILLAIFAPLLLFPVCWGILRFWTLGRAHWLNLPEHQRQGFLRLYAAIAVPWTIWYGYQLRNAIDRYYSYSDRHVAEAFRLLLLVPIGAPIALVLGAWVIRGFQKSASGSEAKKDNPAPPKPTSPTGPETPRD
jgi:hypothetical protein